MLTLDVRLGGDVRALLEGGLTKAVARAARAGTRDGARTLRTRAARYVRGRKALPLRRVNEALAVRRPARVSSLSDVTFSVRASGRPVPLSAYPVRQTRRGVAVRVNRQGGRKTLPGAFLVTLRTGHLGVFRRVGKPRLPIRELYSSTVADTLRDREVPAEVLGAAAEAFAHTFRRLFPGAP